MKIEILHDEPVSPNLRDGDTGFTCAYPFATVVSEGKVLCVYRRGREKHSDDGILVMQQSSDNGRTWSEPATVFDGLGLTPPQVAVTGTIATSDSGGVVSTIGVVDVTRPGVYLFSEEGLLQKRRVVCVTGEWRRRWLVVVAA